MAKYITSKQYSQERQTTAKDQKYSKTYTIKKSASFKQQTK